MSRLDQLPPDQRAALSLLLGQGKGYAEVAALLQIGERAVQDRAHAALAVLAPRQARELTPEGREEIGDYLLGQRRDEADRLRARTTLERSPAAQAWARALAAELAPLAPGTLPEIPGEAAGARQNGAPVAARHAPAGEARPAPSSAQAAPGGASVNEPASPAGHRGGGAEGPRTLRDGVGLPSSRVGGAVLLGAIAGIVVAVVLLTSGGSSHHRAGSASGASTSGASSTARAAETNRLTLTPVSSSSKAIGVAAVLQEGSTYAFYIAAEHLPPTHGFFYAVWLYNSPSSFQPLNKTPAVGSDGRMQGGAILPANASSYSQMILTRETSEHPSHPGTIVLRGAFALR